jgi:transcriptional regulator with GAF, ATPase, and Fis domain
VPVSELQDPQHVDLGSLIKDLYRDADVQGALDALVARSVALIEGCDYAGVTLADRSGLHTVSASDRFVEELDAIQYAIGDGPCISALRRDRPMFAPEATSEERWPRYMAALSERGIGSLMAFPLDDRHRPGAIGALNLYGCHERAFSERDEVLGSVLTAAASVALAAARQLSSLNEALHTRETIGVAKGILMARNGVGNDQAFAMLREASQHANRPLRDIAAEVAAGSPLPGRAGDAGCAGPRSQARGVTD